MERLERIDLPSGGSFLKGSILARRHLKLRASACRIKCPITMGASPQRKRKRHWIDLETHPPRGLITMPVKLAMMKATNRNRVLVADFAAQRTRLRKAKMMRIGRFAAAHDARLLRNEF